MKIYYFTQMNEAPLEEIQRLFPLFPEERRKKALVCKTPNRMLQSAVAYLLAVYGLKREQGMWSLPALDGTGKPALPGSAAPQLNLTHCERGVAAVFDSVPVGIDMECIRPFDRRLAEYVCSPAELAAVLAAENPAVAFTVLWTKKESWLKLYGKGIGVPLKTIGEGFSKVAFHTITGDGWVLTACREVG